MSLKLWTISYQGRSAEEIVSILRKNGIERVVHIGDVAPDLEGSGMEEGLKNELVKAEIEFRHVDGVGHPPGSGDSPVDHGRDDKSSAYQAYLSRRAYKMEELDHLIQERPTAILCYLRGEEACEGSIMVQMLRAQGNRIENL